MTPKAIESQESEMPVSDTPERFWVGSDERDYHPVFLSEKAAREHGWNDIDGADAPEYIRADIVSDMVEAGHLTYAHHAETVDESMET
jgi:hypothetical protein